MKNYLDIFWQFLILGFTSFGGPIAHLGYFRKTFVEKLKWLDDVSYARIVALSQFLPGPSSSQVGFSIGLRKGGLIGGLVAFISFTLPSFLILYFLATLNITNIKNEIVFGIISGLKLFAVIIVMDALFSMFKSFCTTKLTIFIFILSSLVLLVSQNFILQILVIIFAGIIGAIFSKSNIQNEPIEYKKPNIAIFGLFILILIFSFLFNSTNQLINLFNSFYQVGSLVFGGGHVILPLIAQNKLIDENSFLLGYAFAQAVPGPMFTIASYLGAINFQDNPLVGSLVTTIAIFLPGFLLILAFEKSFESYSKKPIIAKALIGINASVVSLIFVSLCNPIFPSGIKNIFDLLALIVGLFLLRKFKVSIILLIVLFCFYGVILN